jgi:hypothetical protein
MRVEASLRNVFKRPLELDLRELPRGTSYAE